MNLRAAIYARVSSAAQRERETIESQLRVLPEYVQQQGWLLVGTYVDDGRSAKAGKLDEREGFARLLRDAEARAFDVVVVVDIDRLTRTDSLEERARILGPFQRQGIDIVTIGGGRQDLRSMMGELYVTLQALVAAEENRKRAARSRAGKLTGATRGRKIGGPTPYGLQFDRATGVWSLDPVRAPIVREVFERAAAGEPCPSIADDLARRGCPPPGGAWQRGRLTDLLRSRHPVGEYTAHRASRTVVAVPAIISDELWLRARRGVEANRKHGLRRTRHVYLLEGLAVCGACGQPIRIRSGYHGNRGRTLRPADYVCAHRLGRKPGEPRCDAPPVRCADADVRVWDLICAELADPGLPAELAAERRVIASDDRDWARDAEGYRAHLARLDKVTEGLLARFRRGVLEGDMLDRELGALNRERSAVRAQLATAERARGATQSAQSRLRDATAAAERYQQQMAATTAEERRALVQELLDPGGAVFRGRQIVVELWVARPANQAKPHGDLAVVTPSSANHESYLRIRAVA